ncbi:MAG: peroxide stress protein YaaA [Sulfurovaceae bacterium]|nr:peroxide stress protein YaaA [Sulfurovaceae bacterium]MDD5548928.1 peroxide stress protein YaaA [Sulfurovaceae bacterium]
MKILLAPSETKTLYKDTVFDINNLLFTDLLPHRKDIIEEYNKIIEYNNPKEIREMFGLKKDSDILQYLKIINDKSIACKAIKLYTGVAFDYLGYDLLETKAKNYIEKNVIIFSNLFGPVSAGDNLPLYRLQQGKNVRNQKTDEIYKKYSSSLLDEYLKDDDILDIRAGYYDKFYIPNKNYTILKFLKDGKVVSHWAKAYRGKVLQELAKNDIQNINDFLALNIDGLQIVELQTKKNKTEIIYKIGI